MLKKLLYCFLIFTIHAHLRAADLNDELLVAAKKGDLEAVKSLLARGAEVNAKGRYGATSLSYAADRGHIEIVKVLLEHGADVNVKDTFYNATPVTWAVNREHFDVVRLLVDKGADTSQILTGIAASGNIELVRAILAKGKISSPSLTTALNAAKRKGHKAVEELLLAAGAVPPPPAIQLDLELLKKYAGRYRSPSGSEYLFLLQDAKFRGGPMGQNSFALEATDQVTFRPVDFDGITVTFELQDGKVVGFTLKQGATTTRFQRID